MNKFFCTLIVFITFSTKNKYQAEFKEFEFKVI